MKRREDSNKNRIRISIDRSVEVRNNKSNASPILSNHLISPQIHKQLKLPTIKQSRSPSARNKNSGQNNVSSLQQQTAELIKKFSNGSVKQKYKLKAENKRKSSLSQHKLEPNTKLASKRTRSISNMISKNSLIVSTQFEEDEEQFKKNYITNLPKQKIKIEIIDKVSSTYEQQKFNFQNIQNNQKTENSELNSLRHSLFSIIQNSRAQRQKFHQISNTDEHLQLLEQLYLQNAKLVRNYVQIRQEAQQLDLRVRSIPNQKKQFKIQ